MTKIGIAGIVRAFSFISVAILLQGSNCLPDIKQPVDNALASVDNAIATLGQQSSAWQTTLTKLEQDLVAQGQSTIANQVQSLLNRGIATGGVELRCDLDFIGNRMLEGLSRIRASLTGQPQQPLQPFFCQIDPTTIDLRLPPQQRNTINVYGYNFDQGTVQALLYDQNGSSVSLASWTNSPTHYLMTLNTVNAPFKSTSLRVGFKLPAGEERTVGIIQPPPCGNNGQACCSSGASCNDANADCVSNVCTLRTTTVLIRGTVCGLGHSANLPNPSCAGQIIREGAPNGNCPAGWQLAHMCDMGASSGTDFFACELISDTTVTAIPAGLLCGYGHTQNNASAICGNQQSINGCPAGFQLVRFGDLGTDAGQGFYGCVAGSAITLSASTPTAPRGTLCGLSHTCNNNTDAHQCGPSVVQQNNPATCPSGYSLAIYGDRGASSGQGQYSCVKQ